MKKGCLFLLAVLVLSVGLEYWLLDKSGKSLEWWGMGLLALGITITMANVYGIYIALRQKAATKIPPANWKDGLLIGVCGRISAIRSAMTSPISGSQVVLYEYEIKRMVTTRTNNSTSTSQHIEFSGFGMVPCNIQTMRGGLRVVGFPLLVNFPTEGYEEESSYDRISNHMVTTEWKEMSGSPLKALKAYNEILSDDDGDLKVDILSKNPVFHPEDPIREGFNLDQELEDEDLDEEEEKPEDSRWGDRSLNRSDSAANNPAALNCKANLKNTGCVLYEQVIDNGMEVTAFGTYRENPARIDIGSGIQNLSHQIYPGKLEAVLAKKMRNSFLASLFWGLVAAAGHWFVFRGTMGLPDRIYPPYF